MNGLRNRLLGAAILAVAVLRGQVELLAGSGQSYDLSQVEGMEHFGGSGEARSLLASNGFVVADPLFKDGLARGTALATICELQAQECVRSLLPVLDETLVVVPVPRTPARAWRLCDQAAVVIARLLGWDTRVGLNTPLAKREELIRRTRDWARLPP
jgi:hypothetical protein